MKIKKISAKDTYSVRHPVLRKEKKIESCSFDGDNSPTTTHFGYYEKDMLIGVISLFKTSNALFEEKEQYQIRGMAILESFQKKGIGKKLIEEALIYCKNQEAKLIWFNAREVAVGFYSKLGFKTIGTSFVIKDIGKHFVMFIRNL